MASSSVPAQPGPARVYALPGDDECWLVEPPDSLVCPREPVAFRGRHGLTMALQYAFETFGAARFFPFGHPP